MEIFLSLKRICIKSYFFMLFLLLLYPQNSMAVKPLSGGELESACRAYAAKAAQNTQQWIANNCRQKLSMTSQLLEYDYNRHYNRCKETLGTSINNDLQHQENLLKKCMGVSPPPQKPPQDSTGTPTDKKPEITKKELINNTQLKALSGWTIHEWYKPSNGKGEVISEPDGIRFRSTSGNHRIGIMQKLNVSVSTCKSLILTATVKADYQTLTGTGWQGREAPVAVFMAYTDANGVVHNFLSENPNDTARRMFWHGFYYADPVSPSITAYGTKVPKGQWYTYTFDLMTLYPKPVYIDFVGAEGAGWATRDGKIRFLSIQCMQ
ncbi:hypothetical protein [Thermodesulfovibrio yellowstonii]